MPFTAIAPAWGMVEAWAKVSSAGFATRDDSAAIAYSAKPPINARLSPYTSSPGWSLVTPSPTSSTTPAMSEPRTRRLGFRSPPIRAYPGEPVRPSQSLRLIDVAAICTRTCPAAGRGDRHVLEPEDIRRPYRSWTTAFTSGT